MKLLFALLLSMSNWYYIPTGSPSVPVEVESVDLNLKNDELALTFFALSDGETTLIQHGNRQNILINAGGNNTKTELEKLLALYNINNISSLILTKEDSAKSNNVPWLIERFNVKSIITHENLAQSLKPMVEHLGIKIDILSPGDKIELLPNLKSEVLYVGNNENEGLDFSLKYLKYRMFFMTSSSEEAQNDLMKKSLADVNIVKVPNYAQSGSISEKLIKHMDPQVAVIYQSKRIKPCPDLFELFKEAWIDVYYTKKHGTVTMKFTDMNYEVITISNDKELK